MHFILAFFTSIFYLSSYTSAEISAICRGQYNAFANCQINTVANDALHRSRRNRLQENVNECFRKQKCPFPVYGTDILPLTVKQKVKSEAWTTETLINSCRAFNDKQVGLINECRKKRTGKDANDVRNFREKYYNRADFIFDGVAISKAMAACPLTKAIIKPCVTKVFQGLHENECTDIKNQCLRMFTSSTCRNEFINFNDDVCSCVKEIRAGKPARAAKTRLNQNSPSSLSLPNLANNKLISTLLDKTGLTTLFSAGLRLKRQIGGTPGTAGNKLDLQQLFSLFQSLQLPTAAGNLDTATLEAGFGLTAVEVNNSLSSCDSTRNPKRLYNRLGTTPKKLLQLACDCNMQEPSSVLQKNCLNSPNCVGTVNYEHYMEAHSFYKQMNIDHMRYTCSCNYPPAQPLRWRFL